MNTYSFATNIVLKANSNDIPGLEWRGFNGESDFPKILSIIHGCATRDGVERAEQLDDVVNQYTHLVNSDPTADMLFAEVDGNTVAYSRVWWALEGSGMWVGFQAGFVLPEWRHKGIGSTLLRFNETRLQQIARQLKDSGQLAAGTPCVLDNFTGEAETERISLLEKNAYRPVRYSFEMVRPNLEDIPELPLPDGVQVREVKLEHMRLIWEASNEAFRDHWGYIPDPWENYEQMMSDPDFDPSLFRVAWQDDQVAGMVLNFINKDENAKYGRQRGYTENICVRRPWRRQGLAKALIARSLMVIKERGMAEAALGVDTENTSGALNLYKSMGYQVVKKGTIYRKSMNVEMSER